MGRILPHFFSQYKANEKLTLGLSFYTPYGLITDYKNGWFGSDHGVFSGLKVMDLSAGFAYQVHPMFSVGAAINGQYIHARLTGTKNNGLASTDMNGDDMGAGYMLGATFTPQKNIRLGVSYRSKVSHELKGDLAIASSYGKQEMDIKAKLTTPELLLISGAYDVNEKLTLSASARWTKWQRFKDLNVFQKQTNAPLSSTHENWKNTWFYSIGADYKVNDNWTVRLGTAYDETVIKSAEYRTVRVPDGRRIFASFGLSYATGNWQYDLAYTHVWMRGGEAIGGENNRTEDPNVRYSHAGAYMGGFSVQYKF
jgi:long-chain fatty acid transport protein